MKKIFTILSFLLAANLWAETPSLTDFYFIYGGDWELIGGKKIGVHENMGFDMYEVLNVGSGIKVPKMSLFVDENGFVKLLNEDTFYLILGTNINIGQQNEDSGNSDYILPSIVKSISSEDFLTEKIGGKTVEYKAENLLKSAVWSGRESPYAYNCSNTPFVPKNNGKNGVGTKLTINLKKAQNKILILGGYVDPYRHPDYYYKNCRPKTVKIKDLDSDYSVICELTDYAIYQSFDFGKPLTNIEIEVLEVYKGTKYSDLCISGILFK